MPLGNYSESPNDWKFELFGIPVRVVPWFWLMAVILGWNHYDLGVDFLLVWVFVVFISILVHELGHAFMGRRFGYRSWITLYQMGGLAQFDRMAGHTLPRSILISFAGPAAGFVLYGIFLVLEPILFAPLMQNMEPRMSRLLAVFLGDMQWVNLWWGLINLLPVLPLDGGQICRDLCLMRNRHRGYIWALRISIAAAAGAAWLAYLDEQQYTAVLFVMLGVDSFTNLQQARQSHQPWT